MEIQEAGEVTWNRRPLFFLSVAVARMRYTRWFTLGHILLVYSDGTCLRYQHYNGSSWDVTETTLNASYDAYWSSWNGADTTVLLGIRDTSDYLIPGVGIYLAGLMRKSDALTVLANMQVLAPCLS